MNFPGFYGNKDAKEQLSAMLHSGRFPHALLLQGSKGCGKQHLAGAIAQALLCTCEDDVPCRRCEACKKVEGGGHPDVYIAVGGEGARTFHIDVIRFIRGDVSIVPNEGKRKVYILANASSMTDQAQNALLKVMEEPPEYACFILTCQSASQMLPTILSRAVTITVGEVEEAEAVAAVLEQCPEKTREQAEAAFAICGGNIGKIKETLNGGILSRASEVAEGMVGALTVVNEYAILEESAVLLKDKELCRAVFGQMLAVFRAALLERSGYPLKQEGAAARKLSQKLTQLQLTSLISVIQEASIGLDRYANHPLLVTRVCARLREAAGK